MYKNEFYFILVTLLHHPTRSYSETQSLAIFFLLLALYFEKKLFLETAPL